MICLSKEELKVLIFEFMSQEKSVTEYIDMLFPDRDEEAVSKAYIDGYNKWKEEVGND